MQKYEQGHQATRVRIPSSHVCAGQHEPVTPHDFAIIKISIDLGALEEKKELPHDIKSSPA